MKTRLITASVGVSIAVAILLLSQFISPLFTTVVLSLLTALMVSEVLTAKKLLKEYRLSLLSIAFGFAMPMVSFTRFYFLPFFVYLIAMLCMMVFFHREIKLSDVAYSFFTTVLITTGMASTTYLTTLFDVYTAFYAVLIMGVPWIADAGAYFVGMKYGKRKLCPSISPKKTVEGALGGVLSGILSALLIGFIFDFVFGYEYINYLALIIIGIVNTPLSILGDLSFSIIKRQLGIKDYGSIMPGHGGMLDRFDSVIVTAPFVYIVALFTVIIF